MPPIDHACLDDIRGYVGDKLTCAVCQCQTSDPVQLLCKSQHLFCFACVYRIFKSRPIDQICCPMCRGGDGAFVFCSHLSRVSAPFLVPDADGTAEPQTPVSSDYYRLLPHLKRQFGSRFLDDNTSLVRPDQMALFSHNYETLCRLDEAATAPLTDAMAAPDASPVTWRGVHGRAIPSVVSALLASGPRVPGGDNDTQPPSSPSSDDEDDEDYVPSEGSSESTDSGDESIAGVVNRAISGVSRDVFGNNAVPEGGLVSLLDRIQHTGLVSLERVNRAIGNDETAERLSRLIEEVSARSSGLDRAAPPRTDGMYNRYVLVVVLAGGAGAEPEAVITSTFTFSAAFSGGLIRAREASHVMIAGLDDTQEGPVYIPICDTRTNPLGGLVSSQHPGEPGAPLLDVEGEAVARGLDWYIETTYPASIASGIREYFAGLTPHPTPPPRES